MGCKKLFIILHGSVVSLPTQVQEYMRREWELYGQPFATGDVLIKSDGGECGVIAQAMTKEKKEEKSDG